VPFSPQAIVPLSLLELQAAFSAHIAGDDRADLITSVIGDSISAAARLRVHRHHVLRSLASALAATFPTVQSLVGEEFFRGMAQTFVAGSLPEQPVLSEYGADFATFVEGYGPAGGLPYLADIARLAWALNVAFHSPFEPPLTATDLATIPVEELPSKAVSLAPGVAVVRSSYPIDRIWLAARPDASNETVDPASGDVRLLVLRQPDDAAFVALTRGEASFLQALADGFVLEEAAGAALAAEADFDLSSTFARFLASHVFAAVQ
jgi:hypothetical protein